MSSEVSALPPGSIIGILGGGQLARMLSVAAARLGLRCHIYDAGANPPAGQVAEFVTTAAFDDEDALRKFASRVDVITCEWENVPAATLELLAPLKPVRPGPRAFAIAQDRLVEKEFLNSIGLPTAPYANVENMADMEAAVAKIGTPAILKTRRMGYDGKGQARLKSADDITAAFDAMAGASAVLEGFVEFNREISVIGARAVDGQVACFDPAENVHRDGILHTSTIPGDVTAGQRAEAALAAGRILNALDYVGVIGVEFFQTSKGLVVNEIAPRVHNSGHWTIEACMIDQFEQHMRAVAGWPLGDGARHANAVMTNLIGEDAADWSALASDPNIGLHLYGKAEIRAGRKMGHITKIAPKR